MSEELEHYVEAHIDAEPEHLSKLYRDTHLRLLYPRMCSGHVQGRLLKMLVRMINPRRVLELGTYSGYAAQCMAEGLTRPDAELHTIEIDDELEDFLREHFAASPVVERITLHVGDARKVLAEIGGDFDLVFIDANKRIYVEYYELVMERLAPGGFIIADNTLWDGKVTDTTAHHDAQTLGIAAFNDVVARDPRVERVMIPLSDGLTLFHRLAT